MRSSSRRCRPSTRARLKPGRRAARPERVGRCTAHQSTRLQTPHSPASRSAFGWRSHPMGRCSRSWRPEKVVSRSGCGAWTRRRPCHSREPRMGSRRSGRPTAARSGSSTTSHGSSSGWTWPAAHRKSSAIFPLGRVQGVLPGHRGTRRASSSSARTMRDSFASPRPEARRHAVAPRPLRGERRPVLA